MSTLEESIARRAAVSRPPNNIPYVIAVVVMMTLGVIGVVAVTFARPTQDNTVLVGLILGFLAPTTLSLLAFMKSQETHLSVNSRLEAFMQAAEEAARAQGVEDGRTRGRDDANARTDALAISTPVAVAAAIELNTKKHQEFP